MYKNLQDSADSNVKKINFDLQNKVSQRITRNGWDVHIDYRRTACTERNKWYILTHLAESGYCLQINPNYQVN